MMPKKNSGQIKDQEKDEALRNQGMSKEKATRIVSAGQEASKKGGNHPKYKDWTKDDVLKKSPESGG